MVVTLNDGKKDEIIFDSVVNGRISQNNLGPIIQKLRESSWGPNWIHLNTDKWDRILKMSEIISKQVWVWVDPWDKYF